MKSNKNQLKAVLKECLVEIMEEGLFDEVFQEAINEAVAKTSKTMLKQQHKLLKASFNKTQPKRVAANDMVQPQEPVEEQPRQNEQLLNTVKQSAAMVSKGDKKAQSMFAKIFEDTATTTLQEQMGSESAPGQAAALPENPAVVKQEKKQLEELAQGKGMKRWAKVAFAGKK